jgi:hypothetical protein
MSTITIAISDKLLVQLRERADNIGLTPDWRWGVAGIRAIAGSPILNFERATLLFEFNNQSCQTFVTRGLIPSLYPTSFFRLFEGLEGIGVGFHTPNAPPNGHGTGRALIFLALPAA